MANKTLVMNAPEEEAPKPTVTLGIQSDSAFTEAAKALAGRDLCSIADLSVQEMAALMELAHVRETGNYFLAQLRKLQSQHAAIKEVRGLGLMIGVEIESVELAKYIATGLIERRIIINRTHETVLRFLPPFLITREHVDQAIAAIDDLLTLHTNASAALAGEAVHG